MTMTTTRTAPTKRHGWWVAYLQIKCMHILEVECYFCGAKMPCAYVCAPPWFFMCAERKHSFVTKEKNDFFLFTSRHDLSLQFAIVFMVVVVITSRCECVSFESTLLYSTFFRLCRRIFFVLMLPFLPLLCDAAFALYSFPLGNF